MSISHFSGLIMNSWIINSSWFNISSDSNLSSFRQNLRDLFFIDRLFVEVKVIISSFSLHKWIECSFSLRIGEPQAWASMFLLFLNSDIILLGWIIISIVIGCDLWGHLTPLVPLTLVPVLTHIRHLQYVSRRHHLAPLVWIELMGEALVGDISLRGSRVLCLFLVQLLVLLTLKQVLLILLELLIDFMQLMRTQTSPYFWIVLLINLYTWLKIIVMIILVIIILSIILVEHNLRLMMIIISLWVRVVLKLCQHILISVDIGISDILIILSNIIKLLLLILLILLLLLQFFLLFLSLSPWLW